MFLEENDSLNKHVQFYKDKQKLSVEILPWE